MSHPQHSLQGDAASSSFANSTAHTTSSMHSQISQQTPSPQPTSQNVHAPSAPGLAGSKLDICFYPQGAGDHHDWQDISYVYTWTDQTLFKELSQLYRKQRLYTIPSIPGLRLNSLIQSLTSFIRLSHVRLTSFTLVPDIYTDRLKASCTEYSISQGHSLEPFRSKHTQAFLAKAIRSAHRLEAAGIPQRAYSQYYFTRLVACIVRASSPALGVDAKGTGIEFVESWHEKKFMLQLVVVALVSIVASIAVGLKTQSKETGFTVLGAVIASSQLVVAACVLLVPPPGRFV
jgi:hypothetical protein